MASGVVRTRCAVAGGGPAGMMLGLLLARAGVDVLVLEKHADFLRDFRGDTIHPSTLQVLAELGLLEEFLTLPHQEAVELYAEVGGRRFPVADFAHLPARCRFLAFVPQWDFLDFLAGHAARHAEFDLRMRAEVRGLVVADGRVAGLHVNTPDGPLEVRAELVVGADGRSSVIRDASRLPRRDLGAPMDVLWFRLPREPDDPGQATLHLEPGAILVMIDRGEEWQLGYVIRKGSLAEVRAAGLEQFRARIAALAPFLAGRVGEIADWDAVKLLTVQVGRLLRWWRPGLLCIGDAAHPMSPVGGVGINLAVQDAVATANLLAAPLRAGHVTDADLRRVQRRRELPARVTQRAQVLVQNRVIGPALAGRGGGTGADRRPPAGSLPLPLRVLDRVPALRRLPGRAIGLGVRPEHPR